MKVEVLYPEVANLYGELGNIRYLQLSVPDAEITETSLNERPKFLDAENGIDLVYMGTMTESAQIVVRDTMQGYLEDLKTAIERGQRILVTGNALEIFGSCVHDVENGDTEFLNLFPFHTERDLMHRYNSLYIGKYDDLSIVGYKSQFTQSYPDGKLEPLFQTVRGCGLNPDIMEEGIRYKNFMATYIIGPLFVLNPKFMVRVLEEAGMKDVHPAYEKAALEAYEERLAEYSEPDRGFIY